MKEIKKRKVIIVLPAYNEEANMGKLLDRIDDTMHEFFLSPYQLVIVDDGSQDSTLNIIESKCKFIPIILEKHKKNMGLGATIRDGLLRAVDVSSDKDIIITMDADDTHTPGLILRMVQMIHEGLDVVIASRYQHGSRTIGVPFYRKFFSYIASLIFRLMFHISGVKDFTCGYRAYRAGVIKSAINRYGESFIDQDGFQCMVDILLKLRKMDIIFGEVPFILRYDNKQGKSKMNVMLTIKKTLILILRRILGR